MSRQKAEELFTFCQEFIKAHDIGCAETIHQSDRVILAAPDFIEGICNIVGYVEVDEDS